MSELLGNNREFQAKLVTLKLLASTGEPYAVQAYELAQHSSRLDKHFITMDDLLKCALRKQPNTKGTNT